MNKAVLILDEIPDGCVLCPCCDNDSRCWAADGKPTETQLHGANQWGKPHWCPLRPMPSTLVDVVLAPDSTLDEVSYMTGWNDCIDAILGGEKNAD